jgi:hypothetical protein
VTSEAKYAKRQVGPMNECIVNTPTYSKFISRLQFVFTTEHSSAASCRSDISEKRPLSVTRAGHSDKSVFQNFYLFKVTSLLPTVSQTSVVGKSRRNCL